MARHEVKAQSVREAVEQRPRTPVGAIERAEHLAETGEIYTADLALEPTAAVEVEGAADEEIMRIAGLLPDGMKHTFLEAIDKIRTESGKGKVRIKTPTPEEQEILNSFRELGTIKAVCEATGLPHHRVHYVVTRKFGERPVTKRRGVFKATPALLAFIREGHAAGVPLMAMRGEVERLAGKTPSRETMERLAGEAGVHFAPNRLDPSRYDEVVADVIALERKYGVSIGTLCVKFYEHTRAVVDRSEVRGATT